MPNNAERLCSDTDRPSSLNLAEVQSRQASRIKAGRELMRELDEVTARIAQHQANRDQATARWNKG